MVAGCDSKPAAEAGKGGASAAASVLGTYENAPDKMTVILKADDKCTLVDEGKSTDLKWERDGASRVVIHGVDGFKMVLTINSEGHLSYEHGGVFRKK